MAVDIKTLRIGSHVEYNGKRVRVALVREDGCICEYKDNGQDVIVGLGIEKKPIPITPELLKELGFERDMRRGVTAYQIKRGEMWMGVAAMHDGLWRIEAMDDTYCYGNCIVRYLHEAELFLGLHNIELIKA